MSGVSPSNKVFSVAVEDSLFQHKNDKRSKKHGENECLLDFELKNKIAPHTISLPPSPDLS